MICLLIGFQVYMYCTCIASLLELIPKPHSQAPFPGPCVHGSLLSFLSSVYVYDVKLAVVLSPASAR